MVDFLLEHNADINISLEKSGGYHEKFKIVAGDIPLRAAIFEDEKYLVNGYDVFIAL